MGISVKVSGNMGLALLGWALKDTISRPYGWCILAYKKLPDCFLGGQTVLHTVFIFNFIDPQWKTQNFFLFILHVQELGNKVK